MKKNISVENRIASVKKIKAFMAEKSAKVAERERILDDFLKGEPMFYGTGENQTIVVCLTCEPSVPSMLVNGMVTVQDLYSGNIKQKRVEKLGSCLSRL